MLGHVTKQTYYVNGGEVLSGKVNGQPASDLEERAAISHAKIGIPFNFRTRINPLVEGGITQRHMNTKGEVEVDIMAEYQGLIWPFMIDGEISHFFTPSTKAEDDNKVAMVNNFLSPYGAHPVIRIPFWLLRTQDAADKLFRQGYANGWPTELE